MFSCRVVSHGPGRASQETSWSGMSFVFVLDNAQKACSSGCSQLFVLSLKVLTSCCLPDSTGYVIPAAHYSVAEEVPPDFETDLPHFQVERVCCAPGRSHTVRCSLKPLTRVYPSLGSLGHTKFCGPLPCPPGASAGPVHSTSHCIPHLLAVLRIRKFLGSPGSGCGSVIICTDPEPDPSVNK